MLIQKKKAARNSLIYGGIQQIIQIQFLQSKVASLVLICQNVFSNFLMRNTP